MAGSEGDSIVLYLNIQDFVTNSGDNNESARVICREGDKLVAEFVTKSWIFKYKTVEEVSIEAPNRITFTHLVGPLHYAWEEFVFSDVDGDTELVHNGEFVWSTPVLVVPPPK